MQKGYYKQMTPPVHNVTTFSQNGTMRLNMHLLSHLPAENLEHLQELRALTEDLGLIDKVTFVP